MNFSIDEKLLLAKAEDVVSLSEKHFSLKNTDFLTPNEAGLIRKNSPRGFESRQEFFGGYPDAERVMFISYPDYLEDYEKDDIITVIKITGKFIETLSHRDFLGSVLGLGVKREKIGDILVSDKETLIFLSADIASYIKDNLVKIGRVGIRCEIISTKEITVPEKETKRITGTVQSVRFDAVLSTALHLSRGKVKELVESEKASINWAVCTSCSQGMKEGDVFSVRGFGRFKLEGASHITKKGRYSLEILKYV